MCVSRPSAGALALAFVWTAVGSRPQQLALLDLAADDPQQVGSLDYSRLTAVGEELQNTTDDFKKQVTGDLTQHANGAVNRSKEYAELIVSLKGGFKTYKNSEKHLRKVTADRHKDHLDEVRSALSGSSVPATAPSTPSTSTESSTTPTTSTESSTTTTVAETSTTTTASDTSTTATTVADSSTTTTASDTSTSTTTTTASDTTTTSSSESAAVKAMEHAILKHNDAAMGITEATAKKARKDMAQLTKAIEDGDEAKIQQIKADVSEVVKEEESSGAGVVKACYDLMGDPRSAERTCSGRFGTHCANKEPRAACAEVPDCKLGLVCKDESGNLADDGWQVVSESSACNGRASVEVCAPSKNTTAKLPPPG